MDLLTCKEVAILFGDLHQSTVWRWVKSGRLPRPVKLSGGTSRWLRSELEAVLARMVEARR
jgi:prophage regulatory protein